MSSLDLKDAYYSVPIHATSNQFLKFRYKGIMYKFLVFPNGLSTCPRRFTKLSLEESRTWQSSPTLTTVGGFDQRVRNKCILFRPKWVVSLHRFAWDITIVIDIVRYVMHVFHSK